MTVEFIFRLFLAGVLGALIVLDREYRAKEAGYRTHFLVSLGSALFMILSQYAYDALLGEPGVSLDPSRIASQVVTGIGFIGAGTIIFQKQIVRGLTTAAGIWVTAGIGMAIGAGMYWLGTSAAALTLVGLEVLSYLFKSIGMKSSYVEFSTSRREVVNAVRERLLSDGFIIASYEMEQVNHERATTYQVTMVIRARKAGEQTLFAILHDFQDEMNLYKVQ